MSTHPDIEAYILGLEDEMVEAHIAGCEACLTDVGREARLELLLHAAGREDAFAAVVVRARRRRRWPLVAAAAVTLAAAAAFALWPSDSPPTRRTSAPAVAPTGRQSWTRPAWTADIAPHTSRCTDAGGDVTCAAASSYRRGRDAAEAEAEDLATEALLDHALARGEEAIRAQRALCRAPSSVGLGQRDTWYWEEYNKLDGDGTEVVAFVRWSASASQIRDFIASYAVRTIDGADIAPALRCLRPAHDSGDDMVWFVVRPGKLTQAGVRAGDLLVHDSRRRLIDLSGMIARHQLRIWRDGSFR